ncbi:hypothetical protein PMSD_06530 [Paenibacillus macquariensis subsp. defensor]|uniref:Uncharacterized protein n=1 Tax=Paenibacillus macquariensis TaxID=948756 RepID=A0ABY1JMP0_9BACL|nr:hypothetical protein [Paenibacillus macquariensis]MEC0092298.1 hypothetical protein [Paenibacillus macquariensis]OAB37159.1 hypothetical protein PMSM_03520 [Paenibacillus macquariensis subsp. macquariensis]OAB38666.1 hypothetical protein PMSD_06530 [Paenibacillus macquariensis subsp. defensor]SIQ46745.1 hypothetical protein SAMN05421578_102123 [Paenibacillus macquariensis]
MSKVYSRKYIETVKIEMVNRLGLKQVYFKEQIGESLIYEAVGFDRGTQHRFCVRPKTGTIDEFVSGKWMKVRNFIINTKII